MIARGAALAAAQNIEFTDERSGWWHSSANPSAGTVSAVVLRWGCYRLGRRSGYFRSFVVI